MRLVFHNEWIEEGPRIPSGEASEGEIYKTVIANISRVVLIKSGD